MPLYEYECDTCGHRFEVIRKFSDPPLETCPKCGKPVHKLISSPAFQFKGTGWYVTDYAKKDSGSGGGGRKSEGSKEGGSESKAGGSDSKEGSSGGTDAAPKSESKSTESSSSSTPSSSSKDTQKS